MKLCPDMIPFAEDDLMTIMGDLYDEYVAEYMVVGRCFSGARFYSEKLCFENMNEVFDEYCDVVKYFGGGEVSLYRLLKKDCKVERIAFAV